MNEKVKIALLYILPWLLFFTSSYYLTKFYYEHSLKRLELCLEHNAALNLPTSICSQISSASDAAYSSATSYIQPDNNYANDYSSMIRTQILINKELKEIKEKLNV